MRMLFLQAFIIGLVVLAMLVMAGCSTSVIVKDCEEPTSSGKQICKTIKPWE